MYIHIGSDHMISSDQLIGVFDIEKTSVSADTRKFLSTSAKRGNEVSCTEDIPRSFIVTFDKEKLDEKICISRISPATIEKRIKNKRSY